MYSNKLRAWWSTQSRFATLLPSLIARRWVGLQTLWRFRLKDLSIYEMVGALCFGCCQVYGGLPVGFLLLWYSVLCTGESLSLLYLFFYMLIYMFMEMMHGWVRGLSCKPNIYVSWSTYELWVRLARRETGLSPPVAYLYWTFQCSTSFVDHLCYLCLVFVMLSCVFIAVLWSPEGKGLTAWLLFVMYVVILLLSYLVSWDMCGTWLYRFLILVVFPTL